MAVRLFHNQHCPYSERARRTLAEKGLHHERIHVAWHQMELLRLATGADQLPTLVHDKEVRSGSGAIARYTDAMANTGTLFPPDLRKEIAAWEREADRLITVTMPLAIPIWADTLAQAAERAAFLQREAKYGDYRSLRRDQLRHWRQVMREWRRLDPIIAARGGYVLGHLTYADIALYGSVFLVAQFHGFEVPQETKNLAGWYERIRTTGMNRDQELLLEPFDSALGHEINHRYGDTRYQDPPI